MREIKSNAHGWIKPTINVLLVVSALLAVAAIVVVVHFVMKLW